MDDQAVLDVVDNSDEYFMEEECLYNGTGYLDIKIYLIGVFGTFIALSNIFFNSFYTLVFVKNKPLRSSPLYYFGILAILDIILAVNYILLMSVPVYFDYFGLLWLYHLFLMYLVPIMTFSNTAMFGSMLLIFMATVERLLRTFNSEKIIGIRQFVERHRPFVCFILILFSFGYKLCTYFEIAHAENPNCTEWSQYEVILTPLAMHPDYKFWWMFVSRNLFDRIIPFLCLILMNILIINTLKKEQQKLTGSEGIINSTDVNNKKTLRDATRALIALVSLYLMGQTLQVLITVIESAYKSELEGDYTELYSYINDIMTLMVLLSSTLRFPVYCSCNQEIYNAAKYTIQEMKSCFTDAKAKKAEYHPITITEESTKSSLFKPQSKDGEKSEKTAQVIDPNTHSNDDSTTTFML